MTQRSQEILIGLVVLVGLVLLAVLIVLFGEFRELWRETYTVTARFGTAAGIRPGTPVFITGVEAGAVEDVQLLSPGVLLTLAIDANYDLPGDCTVSVRRKGILADPFIEFSGGDPASGVLPRDGTAELEGYVAPSFDEAAARLQNLAERLGDLLADSDLQDNFRTTLSNLAELSGRGPELIDRAGELTDELRRFVDLSSQLVEDARALATDARTQMHHQGQNLDRLVASLITNSEELNRSLRSAAEMLDELRRGQGSVGKLLTQDDLYRQLVDTVSQTRKTVAQLGETIAYFREHPEVLVWGPEETRKESPDLWPF